MAGIEWTDLPVLRGLKVQDGAPATIAISMKKGDKVAHPTLRITLAKELLARLGWTKPTLLKIQVSAEARKVRLQRVEAGPRMLSWKNNCASVGFAWPDLVAEPTRTTLVQHVIDSEGDALILSLPAEATQARPVAIEAVAGTAMKRTVPAPPPRGPRRVTAAPPITAGRPTEEEDEAEALEMVRYGSNGRQLAEYFGWELERASAFTSAARLRIAAERAA